MSSLRFCAACVVTARVPRAIDVIQLALHHLIQASQFIRRQPRLRKLSTNARLEKVPAPVMYRLCRERCDPWGVADITDEFMREMRGSAREYSLALLRRGARYSEPDAGKIIWEHGRRNHSLRADGLLVIVCPVIDDSGWSGIGIFDVSLDETARIMDGHPAVQAGVLSYEVHPVRSFPGDSLPGRWDDR